MEIHRDGLGHTLLQTDITLNLNSPMLNQSAAFIAGHKSVWSLFSCTGFPLLLGDMVHSRKLTCKPKKGPIKTTVLLKGGHVGFHLSLGNVVRVSGLGLVRVWTGMQQEKWPLKIVHKDLAMYSYT